jgi:hypothetical protein
MDNRIIDHLIHRNSLRHGLSKILSETSQAEQLLQYKRLVEACLNNKQDDPATLYCTPCEQYQHDSVVEIIERIHATVRETSEILNNYKNFINPGHDN